jgi:hypothetical protein
LNKKYYSSKHILEYGDAIIELLEEVQVESIRELERIEQNWIDTTPNTINKNAAFQTKNGSDILRRASRNSRYLNDSKFREQTKLYAKNKYHDNPEVKERIIANVKKRREIKQYCSICEIYVVVLRQHEKTLTHIRNFIMS